MKRGDLEAHLRTYACQVIREGANHAIWSTADRERRAPVPRHREIPAGTVRAICRQLECRLRRICADPARGANSMRAAASVVTRVALLAIGPGEPTGLAPVDGFHPTAEECAGLALCAGCGLASPREPNELWTKLWGSRDPSRTVQLDRRRSFRSQISCISDASFAPFVRTVRAGGPCAGLETYSAAGRLGPSARAGWSGECGEVVGELERVIPVLAHDWTVEGRWLCAEERALAR